MTKILRNNRYYGFTLVEMLIVIVIIGILASALIPRLSSARARAHDAARKADLQQIATAIVAAQLDKIPLPVTSVGYLHPYNGRGVNTFLGGILSDVGMSSIPTDPIKNRGVENGRPAGMVEGGAYFPRGTGQYLYITVKKGGQKDAGFVLMAATETVGGSNRVLSGNDVGLIRSDSLNGHIFYPNTTVLSFEDISKKLCKTITKSNSASNNGTGICTYSDISQLRYIVVY